MKSNIILWEKAQHWFSRRWRSGGSKARGGPFTRFSPSEPENNERKSCLDLVIVSKNLSEHVEELIVDSENRFQISRVTAVNGDVKLTHTDHYTLILKLKNVPLKSLARKEIVFSCIYMAFNLLCFKLSIKSTKL